MVPMSDLFELSATVKHAAMGNKAALARLNKRIGRKATKVEAMRKRVNAKYSDKRQYQFDKAGGSAQADRLTHQTGEKGRMDRDASPKDVKRFTREVSKTRSLMGREAHQFHPDFEKIKDQQFKADQAKHGANYRAEAKREKAAAGTRAEKERRANYEAQGKPLAARIGGVLRRKMKDYASRVSKRAA